MVGHSRMLGLGALALCLSGCAGSKDDGEPMGSDVGLMEGEAPPLIMLLVDTSGSMERVPGCECTTASCSECLPDCTASSPDKNRWTQTLEALTGTYEDFECEARERTDDTAVDFQYPIPYHEPMGSQQDDGVLDELADSVRFGVATFDGTSIVATGPGTAADEADEMQEALLAVRPYGGTPTAAALDELYQLFAEESSEPRHVVLISDGPPDDASPTAEQVAHMLRCGDSEDCDEGVVTKLHVIALDPDPAAHDALDSIASAGGSNAAIVVGDAASLKSALADIIDEASEE